MSSERKKKKQQKRVTFQVCTHDSCWENVISLGFKEAEKALRTLIIVAGNLQTAHDTIQFSEEKTQNHRNLRLNLGFKNIPGNHQGAKTFHESIKKKNWKSKRRWQKRREKLTGHREVIEGVGEVCVLGLLLVADEGAVSLQEEVSRPPVLYIFSWRDRQRNTGLVNTHTHTRTHFIHSTIQDTRKTTSKQVPQKPPPKNPGKPYIIRFDTSHSSRQNPFTQLRTLNYPKNP